MIHLDFHVKIGLHFGVRKLSTKKSLGSNLGEVETLLVVRSTEVLSGHVKVHWLYSMFHGRNDMPVDFLACAFLLSVLRSTILCRKNERVSIHYLEELYDLDFVY